jgi:FHA domain
VTHVYCSECGFQSPAAANFCAKCGALLSTEPAHGETTMSIAAEEVNGELTGQVDDALRGPALVVRAGGGHIGDTFGLIRARTLIGRSPDCEIFLDDVTVSRRHAEVRRDGEGFSIHDLASLNGTFVNRTRIDNAELYDDDEVQIGKYRLTFLAR